MAASHNHRAGCSGASGCCLVCISVYGMLKTVEKHCNMLWSRLMVEETSKNFGCLFQAGDVENCEMKLRVKLVGDIHVPRWWNGTRNTEVKEGK